MPEILIQRQCASIGDADFVEADSFGEPVGPLPKQQDCSLYATETMFSGTWECEVGSMDLDLDLMEFCHLLEGHWKLTSETGVVTEIKAGDSWIFPRGWKGRSEVIEKVRKVYFMML